MKTYLPLFAILLGFSAIAAGIVAWFPRLAEWVSRCAISGWSLAGLVLVCLGIQALPTTWQPTARLLTLAAVMLTLPICFGILFFPTETRDAVDVKPVPAHELPPDVLTRLREPWNSQQAERLPAAVDLVRCAATAYQAREQMTTSIPQLGFPTHEVIENGPAKGVVMTAGQEAVIAFEGTNGLDDIGDWFANLNTSRGDIPEGVVHGGFLGHYNRVADQVRKILDKKAVSHVWITGHSLGGAMAVLCAADLERRGTVTVRGVMTFGQPLLLTPACARVVNETFMGRHLRIVNEADVVPCVAPGFRGGGSLVWVKNGIPEYCPPAMRAFAADDGTVMQDDGEAEGPTPLTEEEFERLKQQVKDQFALVSPDEPIKAQAMPTITDHNMQRYVEAIQKHYGSPANGPPSTSAFPAGK
jgi:predicted lipase